MPKSLTITAEIERLIKANSGNEDMDMTGIAVFEAVLVNTKPLTKRGSIYHNGVVARSTLSEMSEYLVGETVPLHTLHRQGNELPSGKIFHAEVKDGDDGHSYLHGLFYVPKNKEDLVADIDNGVIDEVSVGFKAAKLLCSECGWDYFGEDADFMNFFEQTCGNDHTIGENGVHTRSVGLDKWYETSLVSIGAANKPKILSRAKSVLSRDERERLAANGMAPEAVVLFAHTKETKPMTTKNPGAETVALSGVAEVVEQISTLSGTIKDLETQVADLTAQVETVTKERDEFKTQAEASDDSEKLAQLTTDLEGARDSLSKVVSFLSDQAKAALIASGKTDPEVPEDLDGLLSAIEDSGLKLHQIVGSDGKGSGQDAASGDDDEPGQKVNKARIAAFKTQA